MEKLLSRNKCLCCYKPLSAPEADLSEMHTSCAQAFYGSRLMKEKVKVPVMEGSYNTYLQMATRQLLEGVCLPGVQPKVQLSVQPSSTPGGGEDLVKPVSTYDFFYGRYFILKPPQEDLPNMAENEHLTMRLAALFDLEVVPAILLRLTSGALAYVTRRVDPTGSTASSALSPGNSHEIGDPDHLHMIDFMQILGLADKYAGTMEQVGKKIGELSSQCLQDKYRFFELAVFNFIIGNNDMHLKNFSMLLTENGWRLSPAYDLLNVKIILPKDKEDLALKLGGKKFNHNLGYFERFASVLGLNQLQAKTVLKRITNWLPAAESLIRKSFLPPVLQQVYLDVLHERIKRLNLPYS